MPTFSSGQKASLEKARLAFKGFAGAADEYLADAKAPATMIQYGYIWGGYTGWCEEQGFTPLPAAPHQLLAYVKHLIGKGRSPATIDSYVAVIATVHRLNGHAIDRTPVIEHLKAARRRAGPPRRARPLIKRNLKDLIARMDGDTLRDARDGAMLLLGYAAALRGAELVGLDWQRAGGRAYGGTGFITIEPEGLLVTLLTSKAAQLTTVQLAIPEREMPSLRIWLDRWITHARVEAGEPIFRPIDRHGHLQPARLASAAVARIVRGRMLAHALATGQSELDAVLMAQQFSAHSMRRGYCTSAADARVPLGQIRPRSRHTSDATLGKYIQSAEGWLSSGLEGVGF